MEIINLNQSDKWDEIVKSFPNYDVYYLSGYVKAFVVHGDGEPILLYYTNEKGGRGICVLMIRDVANSQFFNGILPCGKYFDADTPYGYGGFIIDGSVDAQSLKCEFNLALKKFHVNSVFFRFHPVIDNAEYNEMIAKVLYLGKTIALDITSPEIIWKNITSKNRNMIRKAEKLGVEIHHSTETGLFKTFKEIYDNTMLNDNADDYYYFKASFYESISSDLVGNFEIFYATYEGVIISMAIMIFSNGKMHYHLSGSLHEYRSMAPSNLLLYKAAIWGYEHGYKTFHLGGGVGSSEDSLYKFKAAFNRNSNFQFAIGKTIIDSDDYNYLMKKRGFNEDDIDDISYFPQYRANI